MINRLQGSSLSEFKHHVKHWEVGPYAGVHSEFKLMWLQYISFFISRKTQRKEEWERNWKGLEAESDSMMQGFCLPPWPWGFGPQRIFTELFFLIYKIISEIRLNALPGGYLQEACFFKITGGCASPSLFHEVLLKNELQKNIQTVLENMVTTVKYKVKD